MGCLSAGRAAEALQPGFFVRDGEQGQTSVRPLDSPEGDIETGGGLIGRGGRRHWTMATRRVRGEKYADGAST
ncbi:MAG: hypothetical protein HS123_06155 [Solibacteraceae bacterium]|nr:hypothetical protein [Solibacteraceae bacterium]